MDGLTQMDTGHCLRYMAVYPPALYRLSCEGSIKGYQGYGLVFERSWCKSTVKNGTIVAARLHTRRVAACVPAYVNQASIILKNSSDTKLKIDSSISASSKWLAPARGTSVNS